MAKAKGSKAKSKKTIKIKTEYSAMGSDNDMILLEIICLALIDELETLLKTVKTYTKNLSYIETYNHKKELLTLLMFSKNDNDSQLEHFKYMIVRGVEFSFSF